MSELHNRKNAETNKQGWTELDTPSLLQFQLKGTTTKRKQPAQMTHSMHKAEPKSHPNSHYKTKIKPTSINCRPATKNVYQAHLSKQ
jgi:hypothetical protein